MPHDMSGNLLLGIGPKNRVVVFVKPKYVVSERYHVTPPRREHTRYNTFRKRLTTCIIQTDMKFHGEHIKCCGKLGQFFKDRLEAVENKDVSTNKFGTAVNKVMLGRIFARRYLFAHSVWSPVLTTALICSVMTSTPPWPRGCSAYSVRAASSSFLYFFLLCHHNCLMPRTCEKKYHSSFT